MADHFWGELAVQHWHLPRHKESKFLMGLELCSLLAVVAQSNKNLQIERAAHRKKRKNHCTFMSLYNSE